MEAYLNNRQELIRRDRALRRDHSNAVKVSSEEIKADEVLRNIRAHEAKSIWGQQLKGHNGLQQMFPGMEFLTGAQRQHAIRAYSHSRRPRSS